MMRSSRCLLIRSLFMIRLIAVNIWPECASEYKQDSLIRSCEPGFCKRWRGSFQAKAYLFAAPQILKTCRISVGRDSTQPSQTFEENKRSLTQSEQSGHRSGTLKLTRLATGAAWITQQSSS